MRKESTIRKEFAGGQKDRQTESAWKVLNSRVTKSFGLAARRFGVYVSYRKTL